MTRRQPTLRLKRGQETARTHPWIFKGDVADVSDVEPGSAVAAVFVDGDLRLAATGTLTELTGDRVLAFGHPVAGLGEIRLPMAAAEVVTVLGSSYSSFKLSNLGPIVGTFERDHAAGTAFAGPTVIEIANTSIVVLEGFEVAVDRFGSFVLWTGERGRELATRLVPDVVPA